jgi:metal-responsive CopG/Arc/MetJ family transcriptional regulator
MRVHIYLDDELVQQLDEVAGDRGRSAFIEDAVRRELDRRRRWALMWSAVGSIDDHGHEWDDDVAKWVHDQRRADPRRVG